MNLLTTYYECNIEERHKEYLECLSNNINNEYIDKIFLFLEDENKPEIEDPEGKVVMFENSGRVSYSELFQYCNDNLYGEKCAISNSDIQFDETLKEIYDNDLGECFVCLSRWELTEEGALEYERSSDSQDCWIFNSPVPQLMIDEATFFMGQPGCDNRIAYISKKAGMIPTNPSPVIRAIHRHLSEHRTYSWCDRLVGLYLRVYPCDDWEVSRLGFDVNRYEEY